MCYGFSHKIHDIFPLQNSLFTLISQARENIGGEESLVGDNSGSLEESAGVLLDL